MTVKKVDAEYTCDFCGAKAVSTKGSLPRGWIEAMLRHKRPGSSRGHFCDLKCLQTRLGDWYKKYVTDVADA